MDLLIVNLHVLASTSLAESLCHLSSKEFMEIRISSAPLCRTVLFLAESYRSFKVAKQVFSPGH